MKERFEISVTEELAGKFYKPVIKKYKRRKAYAGFKDNIWIADFLRI